MDRDYDLTELLDYIDPAALDYQAWCSVGMILKDAGYACRIWDDWSVRDGGRYHKGDCEKKWDSFKGCSAPVGVGTLVQMAKDAGWRPSAGNELDWNDVIGAPDELQVINPAWVEGQDIVEPGDNWDPVKQLITYLDTLFNADENIGYVTETWEREGKYLPTKGCCDRTAGQLIDQLSKCGGDIGKVIGDYNPKAGAWIRFNPLDGAGVKNDNVTEFRYALVESDAVDLEKQNAIVRELELPVACLVYSGGKSIHAIVRIDATSYEEYRQRVDYLYDVCKKNGLKVDTQNRNPSRLSRMPGIVRNGHKQFLIDTNIGKSSWTEWQEWIEGVNDDLPDPESLTSVWDRMPALSPPLIDGVLRQGHKMLLAGPPKAGKSYSLIQLTISIAEGKDWFGWQCAQGRVLYVNLELDRASCLHRFREVYDARHWDPDHLNNIDIWNLRGKSVPMDKLAPKLIRRAAKKNYLAIIIDPIYKVITGDENSADQMAHFCNQFDKVCNELGAAVIYCHHHSKGSQGQKRSMDRASGSGVFARDPDALLDMTELDLDEKLEAQEADKYVVAACLKWLDDNVDGWRDEVSPDSKNSVKKLLEDVGSFLPAPRMKLLKAAAAVAREEAEGRTAWRIEGTLREFKGFKPINVWFNYPVHVIDQTGTLAAVDLDSEDGGRPWKRNFAQKKSPEDRKKERANSIDTAFEAENFDGEAKVKDLAEYTGCSEDTVRRRLKEHGGFVVEDGIVVRRPGK